MAGAPGPRLRLVAGDSVRLPPVREARAGGTATRAGAALIRAIERAIIHEDERLLVLDKPAGMAVHGGSGLSFGVIEALRAARPAADTGAGASAGPRHQRLCWLRASRLGAARAACAAARGRGAEELSGAGRRPLESRAQAH